MHERCFITREGVSILGISDTAESIGFRTMGVRITFEQLAEEAILPCILHWNQNHFVVCYNVEKHRGGKYTIYIADPAPSVEEFLKCWISTRKDGKDQGATLLRRKQPGQLTGTGMQEFCRALTAAGVERKHTEQGNRYRVVPIT